MTSKDIDFDSALSNEFVLPTNKAVGATRILGEDGQLVTSFIKFSDSKYYSGQTMHLSSRELARCPINPVREAGSGRTSCVGHSVSVQFDSF
jgi:hypothetical protein